MKEEIKDLRRRIADDQKRIDQLRRTIVTDSVSCGKKGKKPIRTVKIKGFPQVEIERRVALMEKRQAKLEMLETDLIEKQMQAEEYIQSIEKSELRIMFRLYYIDSLTWYQVALRMNQMFPKRRVKYTEDNCKQRHKRYLEKVA
ncbi:MAG: hypothetical protein KHY08_10155 [Lachnospiraceae bacterium]|nr:hypothetical protein [Lachnospiraceae bacterium]